MMPFVAVKTEESVASPTPRACSTLDLPIPQLDRWNR